MQPARQGSARTGSPGPAHPAPDRCAASRTPRFFATTKRTGRRGRAAPAARSPGGGALPLPSRRETIDQGLEGVGVVEGARVELHVPDEERRRPGHATGVALLMTGFDPPGELVSVHARRIGVVAGADGAREIPETAAGILAAGSPIGLGAEERVGHGPELPLLTRALRGAGGDPRPGKAERIIPEPPPQSSGGNELGADRRELHRRELAAMGALEVVEFNGRRIAAQGV